MYASLSYLLAVVVVVVVVVVIVFCYLLPLLQQPLRAHYNYNMQRIYHA